MFLTRTRAVVLLGVFLALCGFSATNCRQDFSLDARRSDFKFFCDQFENNYAYVSRREKPWRTWGTRYAAAIDAAEKPEGYAAVIESALDELLDFHAEVRSRNAHRWLPVPTFADIWAEFRDGEAQVVAVRKGSDAERAGISIGDKVVDIQGVTLATAIKGRLGTVVDGRNPDARRWALLSLLAGRSDEVRHISVRKATGELRTVALAQQRRFDRSPGEIVSSLLPGKVGWIRLNNSLGEEKTVAAFDKALAGLRSTNGLILDLRDVPSGGDSSVALGIMGRFVKKMLPYQWHRIPNYGQPDIERNWFEQVAPRGPFTYQGPVVVLVDHWTGSMGEGMAIGFDSMKRARVIGTPMAHLAGAVSDFRLPATGIDVAFATEQLYHVNGTPREKWLPPILVGPGAGDPILKRGLQELKKSPARHQ